VKPDEASSSWTSLVLLERFRDGDTVAADAIFARYFERLTALARSRLSVRLAQRTDPEDIVLSAYRSFFVAARSGRYVLRRAGDLWRLLASITKHKLLRQARHDRAQARSIDMESSIDQLQEEQSIESRAEPEPEAAIALADLLEQVLAELPALGRRVLELRLQGAQLSEIARDTGRSERTVRRMLGQIRDVLASRLNDV
jgi:RNA polymerase sigma factor (sigma-70 family)